MSCDKISEDGPQEVGAETKSNATKSRQILVTDLPSSQEKDPPKEKPLKGMGGAKGIEPSARLCMPTSQSVSQKSPPDATEEALNAQIEEGQDL